MLGFSLKVEHNTLVYVQLTSNFMYAYYPKKIVYPASSLIRWEKHQTLPPEWFKNFQEPL
jgi:hypothetical protein